jgi:glycerate-2-kinase
MVAKAIAGTPRWFAAMGTDGTDGTTEVAGAWVDGQSWQRALQMGLDPDAALQAFDSHRVLSRLGQTIHTGPTGTNVMDLMLWL